MILIRDILSERIKPQYTDIPVILHTPTYYTLNHFYVNLLNSTLNSASILLGLTCNYMEHHDDGAMKNVFIKPVSK